jgi:Lon protease-like protein
MSEAGGELEQDFPLFPLGIVALPCEIVPLHIFEERYKTMIGECLAADREFGIVWLADDGLREIGCACRVERVLEQMDDGRINLLARGTRPLRIVERQGHLAYPAAIVEFVADVPDAGDVAGPGDPGSPGSPSDAGDRTLLDRARHAYAELVKRATDRDPDAAELAEMGAYAMAAMVDFGLEAKQGLLELRSERARLTLVIRLFRAALKRLEFVDRAQTLSRSNGKVRFN